MHVLTALDRDVTIGPLTFPHGISMLVEDVNAGEVMAMSEDRFLCRPWVHLSDQEETSVLFILPGGLGDLLNLTPVLKEYRRALGEYARIAVSCFPQLAGALENLPFSIETIAYPPSVKTADDFGRIVCCERLIHNNPGRHPVDLFSEAAGIVLMQEEKRAIYVVSEPERIEAGEKFPKGERRRVGMQARASANCRTYPPGLQIEIIRMLHQRGHEVFLFGAAGECVLEDSPAHGIVNLSNHNLTFRQSCAVMETCDAFIAPDSSLCHVAGALDLPTVALYGPFPWQSRTIYHPNIHGINGHADCAPCHWHKRGGQEWPAHGPCATSGYCHALANIKPTRVVAKIEQIFRARNVVPINGSPILTSANA